jgi:hypothetical protein
MLLVEFDTPTFPFPFPFLSVFLSELGVLCGESVLCLAVRYRLGSRRERKTWRSPVGNDSTIMPEL